MNIRRIAVTAVASGALLTAGMGAANASTPSNSAPHSLSHQQYNQKENREYKPTDHRYSQYKYDSRDHKDHYCSWQYKYNSQQHKYRWQWTER